MTLHRRILLSSISAALLCSALFPAIAGAQTPAERAAGARERDPFSAVYIVTSRDTFKEVADLTHSSARARDSSGTELIIAQSETGRLPELSERIHERQLRCGGYFAFATRAEAEAFVRADRSGDIATQLLAADYAIDNHTTVTPWLGVVSEATIRATITSLSSYKNRYYTSTYGRDAALWIRDQWASLGAGRSDVSTELFTGCSNCSTQPSVILTVQGSELPSEVLVLGAHLDSVAGSSSTEQTAPGADDDASGVATLTEIIRVALASGWKPQRTVKFMAYAAEEVGLRGSNAIAQSFKTAGTNVVGVMQLDMTNYKSGSVADMRLITDYSNATLKDFLTRLFDAYLAPRGYTRGSYTCGYGCSDHASWTSAGFPSAMMFEAGDSNGYFRYIHSVNDTLANMGSSAQNSVKFAQLGLAFAGELGKTAGTTPPGNVPPVASFSSSFNGLSGTFTDTSSDSDGSVVARSWNFGDGTTSTATNPTKTYAAAGTYSVNLTVTDNQGASNSKVNSITVSGGNSQCPGAAFSGSFTGANGQSQYQPSGGSYTTTASGTHTVCISGPSSADYDVYLEKRQANGSWTSVRSGTGSTAIERIVYSGTAGTYRVRVANYRGTGAYTGSLGRP